MKHTDTIKKVWNTAKNVMLAAFIFGSIGIYLGYHYASQLHSQAIAKAPVQAITASK